MPAGTTYKPIASQTLSSTSSLISFSSIAQEYTDLILIISGSASGSVAVYLRVGNNSVDGGTNYSNTYMFGNASNANSGRNTSTNQMFSFDMNTPQSTGTIHFQNYSNSTTNKTVLARGGFAGTGSSLFATVNLWRSTSPINIIEIFPSSGTFSTGSTFTLYGIAAA
jgi:hypothetical protein